MVSEELLSSNDQRFTAFLANQYDRYLSCSLIDATGASKIAGSTVPS
jgi:hypothetical protein